MRVIELRMRTRSSIKSKRKVKVFVFEDEIKFGSKSIPGLAKAIFCFCMFNMSRYLQRRHGDVAFLILSTEKG